MNRRGFLSALAAVVATAAIDPDELLWVPNRKLVSIPAVAAIPQLQGFMLVGDVFTLGNDPQRWRVTRAYSSGRVLYEAIPVWPKGVLRSAPLQSISDAPAIARAFLP
jgi:hypothetical protein